MHTAPIRRTAAPRSLSGHRCNGTTAEGWAGGGAGGGVGDAEAGGRVGGASAVTQPGGPGRAAQPVGPARDANEPPGPSRGWAAQGVTGREAGPGADEPAAPGGKEARRGRRGRRAGAEAADRDASGAPPAAAPGAPLKRPRRARAGAEMCLRLGEPRRDGPRGPPPPQILPRGRSAVAGARNPGVRAACSPGHLPLSASVSPAGRWREEGCWYLIEVR